MKVPTEVKERYWAFFTAPRFKAYRLRGVTDNRLARIKSAMFADGDFWGDVVIRHGSHAFPRNVLAAQFEHCIGNFYSMIAQAMHERGWLKP